MKAQTSTTRTIQIDITFHQRNYSPCHVVNVIDKLDDAIFIKRYRRTSPVRWTVEVKNKLHMKKLFRLFGQDSYMLQLQMNIPTRTRHLS
jgi:hypothetical protein